MKEKELELQKENLKILIDILFSLHEEQQQCLDKLKRVDESIVNYENAIHKCLEKIENN